METNLRSRNTHDGHIDDWLAEEGEINWLDDPRHGERDAAAGVEMPVRAESRMSGPRVAAERDRPAAASDEITRRRRIAAIVAVGLVTVTAVAVVLATTRGGGSKGSPAAETTPPTQTSTQPTTTQATTTTPATGQQTPETQPTSPSSTLKVTPPAGGKLRVGDTGPEVVTLQKALAALGFDVGEPDGTFGPVTRAAVVDFQTAKKLSPDGIVGPITTRALNDALANSATSG